MIDSIAIRPFQVSADRVHPHFHTSTGGGSSGDRGRHTGYDLHGHTGLPQRGKFLGEPREDGGVASFEPHDEPSHRGQPQKQLARGAPRIRIIQITPVDADAFGRRRQGRQELRVNEPIVHDHVRPSEPVDRPQREQVGCAGTSADEHNGSGGARD